MRYTLKDVVDFCYANKRSRAFKQCGYEEIAAAVINADLANKLVIAEDNLGICGCAIITERPASRSVYVHQIVARRGGFVSLVNHALTKWPGYSISGYRKGAMMFYNERNFYGRRRSHTETKR